MAPRSVIPPGKHASAITRRDVLAAGTLLASAVPAGAQFTPGRNGILALRATYGERGAEIAGELVWRIYTVRGPDVQLFTKVETAKPSLVLPPGQYAIHVSHGLATATRDINLSETGAVASLPINVGALIVSGHLGVPERPIPPQRQKLSLFIPTANNSEGKLVTDSLRPITRLALPEGTYHLVSTYSGSNSVVRTDVRIATGRVTEAVVNHRAATMTLKLVRQRGGVALAGAEWTIETPGGDIVAEAVGAFPSVDIGEGTYNVLARHNDREYRGQMKVEGGINRDFEIIVE
jgi:hypothetical protein